MYFGLLPLSVVDQDERSSSVFGTWSTVNYAAAVSGSLSLKRRN